jgi:hypothetical protein
MVKVKEEFSEKVLTKKISFRLIMRATELQSFYLSFKQIKPEIDDAEFLATMNWSVPAPASGHIEEPAFLQVQILSAAMDDHARDELRESILSKRIASLRWLPVYFNSDLLHGSWWYVWSSLLGVGVAVIVLFDDYQYVDLGNDDSVLPPDLFRLAWGLCLLSSVMFTVGA